MNSSNLSHLTDESDLLSRSSVRSLAHITSKIQALEAFKAQLKLKRQTLQAETQQKSTQLGREINQLRSSFDTLTEHYAALKQSALELSKPQSSRELNSLSNTLEQKLEHKKELAQQKLAILKQTQKMMQAMHHLATEKAKIEQQLNNEATARGLKEKLVKLRSSNTMHSQQIGGVSTEYYQKKMEELKDQESDLKAQLDTDNKAISQSKSQISELEDILRDNSQGLSTFHGQIQQERSNNEQRQKQIDIVETEVREADGILEAHTEQLESNEKTIKELTQGIDYLNRFLQNSKLTNQNIKANNLKLWKGLRASMEQLEQLQSTLKNNFQSAQKLHYTYNAKMNLIITSSPH